jgi:hypothetical protein
MGVPGVEMAVGTGVAHPVSSKAEVVVSRSDFIGLLAGKPRKMGEN